MKPKETYWLFGTLIFGLTVNLILFGIDGSKPGANTALNIYDTYFVFGTIYVVIFSTVLMFFSVYLERTWRGKYKNSTVNLILIISTIGIILVLGRLITFIDVFAFLPDSAENLVLNDNEIDPMKSFLRIIRNDVFATQVLLLILLTYVGFKTGKNYK